MTSTNKTVHWSTLMENTQWGVRWNHSYTDYACNKLANCLTDSRLKEDVPLHRHFCRPFSVLQCQSQHSYFSNASLLHTLSSNHCHMRQVWVPIKWLVAGEQKSDILPSLRLLNTFIKKKIILRFMHFRNPLRFVSIGVHVQSMSTNKNQPQS